MCASHHKVITSFTMTLRRAKPSDEYTAFFPRRARPKVFCTSREGLCRARNEPRWSSAISRRHPRAAFAVQIFSAPVWVSKNDSAEADTDRGGRRCLGETVSRTVLLPMALTRSRGP